MQDTRALGYCTSNVADAGVLTVASGTNTGAMKSSGIENGTVVWGWGTAVKSLRETLQKSFKLKTFTLP